MRCCVLVCCSGLRGELSGAVQSTEAFAAPAARMGVSWGRIVVSGLYSSKSLHRHAATMLEATTTAGEPNAWVCHACEVAGRLTHGRSKGG